MYGHCNFIMQILLELCFCFMYFCIPIEHFYMYCSTTSNLIIYMQRLYNFAVSKIHVYELYREKKHICMTQVLYYIMQ